MRSVLKWVLLGLAGLALAAGSAAGVMHLTSQDVGLSAEPLDAGRDLVPTVSTARTATITTTPQPESAPTRTSDDHVHISPDSHSDSDHRGHDSDD